MPIVLNTTRPPGAPGDGESRRDNVDHGWKLAHYDSDLFTIRHGASGHILDLETPNENKIVARENPIDSTHFWKLEPTAVVYTVQHTYNNRYLDAYPSNAFR